MFETIRIEGNKEFYYNADGKLVFRLADETTEYRNGELRFPVFAEVNKARQLHRYPTRELIDSLIIMQKDSPEKAARYVKYKLLGECSYLDVFGSEFQNETELKRIQQRLDRIEASIADLKNNYYSQLAAKSFEGRSF